MWKYSFLTIILIQSLVPVNGNNVSEKVFEEFIKDFCPLDRIMDKPENDRHSEETLYILQPEGKSKLGRRSWGVQGGH
jgi:hypothetical protein